MIDRITWNCRGAPFSFEGESLPLLELVTMFLWNERSKWLTLRIINEPPYASLFEDRVADSQLPFTQRKHFSKYIPNTGELVWIYSILDSNIFLSDFCICPALPTASSLLCVLTFPSVWMIWPQYSFVRDIKDRLGLASFRHQNEMSSVLPIMLTAKRATFSHNAILECLNGIRISVRSILLDCRN